MKDKELKHLIDDNQMKMKTSFRMGFVLNLGTGHAGVRLRSVLIMKKTGTVTFGRFSAIPYLKTELMEDFPEEISQTTLWMELNPQSIKTENVKSNPLLVGDTLFNPREYRAAFHRALKDIWEFLYYYPDVFSLEGALPLKHENAVRLTLSLSEPVPVFYLSKKKDRYALDLKYMLDGKPVDLELLNQKCPYFLTDKKEVFLLRDYNYISVSEEFSLLPKVFKISELPKVLNEIVPLLQKKCEVVVDPKIEDSFADGNPLSLVEVAEYLGQYLMLIPKFDYEGVEIGYDDASEIVLSGDKFIKRNKGAENEFFESIRHLHADFSNQLMKPFFYLPFKSVMKKSWFLKTIRNLQKEDVAVKGFENLKKFKYHTGKPEFKMKVGGGIDWFDIYFEIRFGDSVLPLLDVRNAILSGEQVAMDKEGRLCLLPDEWLVKFADIFRFGDLDRNNLRVRKNHFTLVEDIIELIDAKEIVESIHAAKKAFESLGEVATVTVSNKINATLRPYQKQGFEWMQSLDHFGWGGCLADDMGLGKTLQVITFLQFLKENYNKGCNLVVCPTSLIYNWESELKKFAPELKYAIHYGQNRSIGQEDLDNNDIIITSYGMIRSDRRELKEFRFHYIILDESQAIKNPSAKVTRACKVLSAKNRIILTGTPIQNDTFDLFAQMDFLNPGLLGNMAFFKREFAVPIDRHQDKDAIQKLKKITSPFILRRTKESVAKDLPDKNEMILWCTMGDEQRKIYEQYKTKYQSMLLNKINEIGIKKSTFYILEGLMRLRQICDSPQLIANDKTTPQESIKTDELLREIKENTGSHKVLVFSQFTSMLAIIKDELDSHDIPYHYLDGKTPGKKRIELVKDFQENPDIKVFLISLKAGGVGLNLTAADYVYIVDPWWNPSVENQAIDRSHRIGQTQKVFAYRMICKDTIEEKIIELQEKKKALSEELISDEQSFVGSLSKEDIDFLFE